MIKSTVLISILVLTDKTSWEPLIYKLGSDEESEWVRYLPRAAIWHYKHWLIFHVLLRWDELKQETVEVRMERKALRARRRLQMFWQKAKSTECTKRRRREWHKYYKYILSLGSRASRFSAPQLSQSLPAFKYHLKTHLFPRQLTPPLETHSPTRPDSFIDFGAIYM